MTLLRIDFDYSCRNSECREYHKRARPKTVTRWATAEGVLHVPGRVLCVACGDDMLFETERRINV